MKKTRVFYKYSDGQLYLRARTELCVSFTKSKKETFILTTVVTNYKLTK